MIIQNRQILPDRIWGRIGDISEEIKGGERFREVYNSADSVENHTEPFNPVEIVELPHLKRVKS